MSKRAVFLMYHELQAPQEQLCEDSAGYRRYVVTEDDFRDHLSVIRQTGQRGRSVTEALASLADHGTDENCLVCMTFDDGCASDLRVAAPLLRSEGFNATFYVTVNHLGRRGYLTRSELRELSELG